MSLSEADIAFIQDLFADLPDLSTRKMFGGLGIYASGVIFALMRSDGQVLIKAQDGPLAERLANDGCEKWTYTRKTGKLSSMPYWTFPDPLLEDPTAATALAHEALDALSTNG